MSCLWVSLESMNLLLLSLDPGAVPQFLERSTSLAPSELRIAYIDDAAYGMPFAASERAGIAEFGYQLIDVRVRGMAPEGFASVLDRADAVYVASGETFLLLDALRSSGAAEVLSERVHAGLPYIGCSAGAIVAGESVTPVELMDNRSLAPDLEGDAGLAFFESVIIPHADGKLPPYPAELIARIVEQFGENFSLTLLEDAQALQVLDGVPEVIPSETSY